MPFTFYRRQVGDDSIIQVERTYTEHHQSKFMNELADLVEKHYGIESITRLLVDGLTCSVVVEHLQERKRKE